MWKGLRAPHTHTTHPPSHENTPPDERADSCSVLGRGLQVQRPTVRGSARKRADSCYFLGRGLFASSKAEYRGCLLRSGSDIRLTLALSSGGDCLEVQRPCRTVSPKGKHTALRFFFGRVKKNTCDGHEKRAPGGSHIKWQW